MATLKIIASQKGMLNLRITHKRKTVYLSLGVRCTQDRLAAAEAAPNRKDNLPLMRLIRQRTAAAEGMLCRMEMELDGMGMTADDIKAEIEREWYPERAEARDGRFLFLSRMREYISRCRKPKTAQVYRHTLSRIEVLMPGADTLRFEDITPEWLRRFDNRLAETSPGVNARAIHMRNIRAVVNAAIDDGITDYYAFRRFRIRHEETFKRSLSVEDLRRLASMELDPVGSYYRDMFMLMFFLIGINTVDLYALKDIESGRIVYRRAKTGHPYSVKVEPEALTLIERHRGISGLLDITDRWKDYTNFRRQCNHALQLAGCTRSGLGGKKGQGLWPHLTTYWTRHTWATMAAELDIPDPVISCALGHSAGNRVTEIYIRRNMRKVDEANRRVIDWVLYGRR